MTADIIMNDPDVVIVGKDQVAHLELTNDIAKRVGVDKKFEYEFGDVEKVMSLIDPTIKMSKSAGESHVLYLFDEDYESKLKRANTNPEGFENIKKIADFIGVEFKGMNSTYKKDIADKMREMFVIKMESKLVGD